MSLRLRRAGRSGAYKVVTDMRFSRLWRSVSRNNVCDGGEIVLNAE